MDVAEAIAKWCVEIETPFVAGIPGNGILEIIDSLDRLTNIPFVLTRHEQGASMMAYSYAFQTRRPAVAVGSKAPGATNLAIGVMGAFVESLPMIVITAQVSSKHEGYEAFEEIDLVGFFKSITKWSVQVHDPNRTIEVLNEAFLRSTTGRPGPVHVAIPYNFMNSEISSYRHIPSTQMFRPNADELIGISDILSAAERPLIIAGGGVPFKRANDVITIAQAIDSPIVTSWMRKSVPDDSPYCIGMAGIGGSPAAQAAIENADVVLALGCRFSEQMTEHYRMRFANNAELIQIDIDPAVIGRVFDANLGIVSDLAGFLPQLRLVITDRITKTSAIRSQWLKSLQQKQSRYIQHLHDFEIDQNRPQGRLVVKKLRELLPQDSVLILDSGNYLHWAEQYFPVNSPEQFHYPTSGTMGFGIPGAIGAKFAYRDRFVCALVGDGGFAMTMSELETCARENIPILVVIINNTTLGHIRIRQEVNFGGRCIGVNFSEQHFSQIAQAFDGTIGIEVNRTSELKNALEKAIGDVNSGHSVVVDVHVTDEMADAPVVHWWPTE